MNLTDRNNREKGIEIALISESSIEMSSSLVITISFVYSIVYQPYSEPHLRLPLTNNIFLDLQCHVLSIFMYSGQTPLPSISKYSFIIQRQYALLHMIFR